jgi:hypothetical protein
MKSLAIYEKDISKGNLGTWINLQCSISSVMLLLVTKDGEGKIWDGQKKTYTRTSHLVHR